MNILNKLTIKHLTMNKKRTLVSIIGIILSTALMVGIGLLLSTFREMMISDITKYNGDYHASISNVEKNKINIIENNSNIGSLYYRQNIGYSLISTDNYENSSKPYYELYGASSKYFGKLDLLEGRLPKNSNEVIISKHILTDTHADFKIGDNINLEPMGI